MGVVRRLQQYKHGKQEVSLGCVCEISKQQNGSYVSNLAIILDTVYLHHER